jgi:hypothetical protein
VRPRWRGFGYHVTSSGGRGGGQDRAGEAQGGGADGGAGTLPQARPRPALKGASRPLRGATRRNAPSERGPSPLLLFPTPAPATSGAWKVCPRTTQTRRGQRLPSRYFRDREAEPPKAGPKSFECSILDKKRRGRRTEKEFGVSGRGEWLGVTPAHFTHPPETFICWRRHRSQQRFPRSRSTQCCQCP